jgi:GT2 family glycosyltransferase/2-polyprenyl-3-methyl-5-hydroxy-6-metoxy-1,4-benzoquinol methylase
MRILTFNWHEPYLSLLTRVGFDWTVADWWRPWNAACRPLPANARLCAHSGLASALVRERRVDLVVCQTIDDLRWLGDATTPRLFLAHNSLPNEVRGAEPAAEALKDFVRDALRRDGSLFVAISEMKLESWGLEGIVIPPGIDCTAFDSPAGAYTGDIASALTVANLLRERGHMLGATELERALSDLPWRILGVNPLLGSTEAASWETLVEAYRSHRFYAHATRWPWEDGYNLALLEAMAAGMPVVTWANPTSPITEGVDGFIAADPEMFRHWAMRLLADPVLARRMGATARGSVLARFPFDAFLERWRTALEHVASAGLEATRLGTPIAANASSGLAAPRRDAVVRPTPGTGGHRATDRASARDARKRVVLATAWTPISTAMYYERAFRTGHAVLTWGPSMDEAILAEWRESTAQHALKSGGTAEEKIRLLRGLTRPADIPARPGVPSIAELLEALPRGWRPDLFVWIDGGPGFLPRDLQRLDCPTVCLVGDSHTQLNWRREYAKAFSHVFVMFNRQHTPLFAASGCARVAWLPAACDPEIHRAWDVARAFDIVFVGQTLRQWHPDRVRLLERLVAAGFDVHVTTKILEEMALAFGRGRIVFNRSLAGDLNMRVFETLATGRMLLTDRLASDAGLDDLFRDGVELVCYDEDNLERLARHYLERPEEREAIARAGREAVLARHTYRHRVATLLATVFEAAPEESSPGVAAGASLCPRRPEDAAAELGHALPAYYRNERPEIAQLVPVDARRVLDVGCAAGGLGRLLKLQGPREVVGIEANAVAAEAARVHLDRVLTVDLDTIEEQPLDASAFDCIICADVLEHLRAPDRLLRNLRRHLAPGGVLIASIPNVRHASVVLPLLVDGRWRYSEEGILDRTHLRFFTLREILELFTSTGFEVQAAHATRTPAHPATPDLASVVDRLGGDAARFQEESSIVQYVISARSAASVAPTTLTACPKTTIVIPVRNRAEFTARCLDALAATVDPGETEIIVVDNGSTDRTGDLLRSAPLPIRVVINAENLGFARAANQGARAARGDLLVFLNNDTEPETGWLEALQAAATEPGVGIVGARLLYPGTRRIQHAGLALNAEGIPDHLWRGVPADDPRVCRPRDVDMVTGACLAIRRALFERLGGFDENYRNGVEDVDLCLAARADALRIRYEPSAVVLHHEGATEGRFDAVEPNLRRFFGKWETVLARMPRHPAEDFGTFPGPAIAWDGSFFLHHSLAGINRALCIELLRRGIDVVPQPYEPDEFDPSAIPEGATLAQQMGRPLKRPAAVRVRHRFPPDFTRRPGEKLAVIQPWEFGAVPVDWVRAIRESVDELWVPSDFVRASFIAGGVPAERVVTIPNGFDPSLFRPDAEPIPLPTTKGFRFLFVGGSIGRKGYDVLLRAYVEEFTADDDVCLIIKDHAYYRHRLDEVTGLFRGAAHAPEILYYWDNVLPQRMAGFYAAASCLVHPFRGEGFGLPILEAMACGRPVIVTDAGPVREFCPDDVAFFVPAAQTRFPEPRVEYLTTVDVPTLAEPDLNWLRRAMRAASEDAAGCRERGHRAAIHAHTHYPWARIAERYAERLQGLISSTTAAVTPFQSERSAPADERFVTAVGLLAEERIAEALPVFAQIIDQEPSNVAALIGAAHCALAADHLGGARALLSRVLQLDPTNAGAHAALAVIDQHHGALPPEPDDARGATTGDDRPRAGTATTPLRPPVQPGEGITI